MTYNQTLSLLAVTLTRNFMVGTLLQKLTVHRAMLGIAMLAATCCLGSSNVAALL